MTKDWNLTRLETLRQCIRTWGPWYTHRGRWEWMGLRDYVRLLWGRATEPQDHRQPVKGPNRFLIVPVFERRFVGIGCVKYAADELTPAQLARADELQRRFDANAAAAAAGQQCPHPGLRRN